MSQRGPKTEVVEIPCSGHAPHLMSREQISIVSNWFNS